MRYLTADQVLFIHYRLISETGGDHSVNDPAGLASILRQPQASLEDSYLPPSLFHSAAVLLSSLVHTSFFSDGNLSTALVVTELLLRVNSYRLMVNHQALKEFLAQIKQGKLEIIQIEQWLNQHSEVLD